mmetsp:Transcript_33975/g.57068  ORF Transcript_33975/g.57068 Transcript_33975/m.57068 type:complete len:218 (+) Transcript_33975:127-780(+)
MSMSLVFFAVLCFAPTPVLGRIDPSGAVSDSATTSAHSPALTLEAVPSNGGEVCTISCNGITEAVACDAGCEGIDKGLCKGAEYILCKAGCLGFKSCVHTCERTIVKPCEEELVKGCHHRCITDVVKPCESECKKHGLQVCEKLFRTVVTTGGCHEVCSEVVAAAETTGGGPLNPVANAIAVALAASCEPACAKAVDGGLKPGTEDFAEFMCKHVGF